jgi:hypothetical protein
MANVGRQTVVKARRRLTHTENLLIAGSGALLGIALVLDKSPVR